MLGKTILKFDQLDSTNDYIKENIVGLDDGTIVVAKQQTKGRGRHGNNWYSPEGNLYFSILIKKNVNRENLFLWTMKSSLAIVRVLEKQGLNAKIKYPNDILINNKKISGILIESIGYEELDAVIIGVGLNVNVEDLNSLDRKATSMKSETKEFYNIDQILKEIIEYFQSLSKEETVYKDYLKRSILLNKTIVYRDKEYLVKSIEKQGNIILMSDQGTITVSPNELSISNFY